MEQPPAPYVPERSAPLVVALGGGPCARRDAYARREQLTAVGGGRGGGLDEARIDAIEAVTDVPLVIHGGSGVPTAQRRRLAQTTAICKYNIGTELRMAFGAALRDAVAADPERFDRVQILKDIEDPVEEAARRVLRELKA